VGAMQLKPPCTLALLLCLQLPLAAHAKTFTCLYTEPLIQTEYDSNKRTLRVFRGTETKPSLTTKVSVRKFTNTQLDVFNKKHGIEQALTLDNQGSDGASDKVYAFSAAWMEPGRPLLYGGCGSR